MQLFWNDFKQFVDQRSLSIQWVDVSNTYWMLAFDGQFKVDCILQKDGGADQIDFETNYKANGNQTPNLSVITQFEKKDYTIKLASCSAAVQMDGTATALLKVPGTPGSGDGRYINAGEAFFDVANAGDKILGVWFIDHDNILGQGVDFVVGSYTDDAADSDAGWFIPPVRGTLKAETIGFYGFAPAGFYIKVVAKKAASITTGTVYVNFEWAVKD